MKPLVEQDHYEILDLARGCSSAEVERAYELARATWCDDSLAGYSVVGALDASTMRAKIEAAFRVLAHPEARRAYDAALDAAASGEADLPLEAAVVEALEEVREPAVLPGFDEVDSEPGECDGARLRRARLRRGVELDDVSKVTKVNTTYLRFLEEERFTELPARVYVRGFVSAYASCVGLDARAFAAGYMQRFDRAKPPRRRVGR
jgi:hypothetical protein